MMKRNDYQRRNTSQGGYQNQGQRNPQEQGGRRDNSQRENAQRDSSHKENTHRENNSRDNSQRENTQRDAAQRDNSQRENSQRDGGRPYYRDNQRQHSSSQGQYQRNAGRSRTEETIEDIVMDISRIEKEIELEIKEIKSLRLGM